ncbi:pleckstrin homology domain-containing family A member 5-like isoform X4 [Denticeps clupeoides]|uniref:pleckstrin homology domain-containing family A member 5-like isoform X4 n=1 Tax=Denticeps clupeoides TaxID=299321 RepID=UPI0010A54AFB|nr:pleckstrin homology domain-containing family A member 5-like isoform X4 [Denticeps clupeoides]
MAADLDPDWVSCLPSAWSFGVSRDGRVFFINEEAKSTTWLHPASGEAVVTGHRKTPDLPTGWEEGFTFEGARCFINHNERKVTCKHPVIGTPSQDNCIFVVNEHVNCGKIIRSVLNRLDRPAQHKAAVASEKERPLSTMSETSNYTGGSGDYATYPSSPAGVQRPSRPSKKVHNFGKRSNSIKRNPNAAVVKSDWLYKQDSTGMKLWKKRWFVLCDMCLFYYRDEKEEGILGSILLPSFHISLLSVDDHINRKYAFKATHPNMRTYYFCTDTAKDMDSWMKAMNDAALVHSEPVKRLDRLKVEQCGLQEVLNNGPTHQHPKPITQSQQAPPRNHTELHNNEQNHNHSREVEWPEDRKQCDAERYGFQTDGDSRDRPLTKITSARLQPPSHEFTVPDGGGTDGGESGTHHKAPPMSVNGAEMGSGPDQRQTPVPEQQRTLQRTNSMQQLEQWVRTQRGRSQDDDTRSVTSYQTLPRNMPSHRAPVVSPYAEGYRTLPRNSIARPDSMCSMSPSIYEHVLGPAPSSSTAAPMDKRRSMRDDTMWQLYEWQQRQAYARVQHHAPYGTMASPKTMINLSELAGPSITPSPSHGSLSLYQSYSPLRGYNASSPRSELSSPFYRADVTADRRSRGHVAKYAYTPDRRSMPAGILGQTITPQFLQGKTPEELTLLLIKLRRQQAELSSARDHTLAQLVQLNLDAENPKNDILSHHLHRNLMYLDQQMKENDPLIITIHSMIENWAPRPQLYQQISPEEYREHAYMCRPQEHDIDSKLSRLCEQDKVVRTQEEKLQQLHREKHTLETALLSASQEMELSSENPTALQNLVHQRDLLQSGLLSTCRELSRVNTELERAWREYDKLEADVLLSKSNLLEQLETMNIPQMELPSQQQVHIQKDLWRIQDVMEALTKNKPQRNCDGSGFFSSAPISNRQKSEDEDSVPPRPPLPTSYNPPAVPLLPSPGSVRTTPHRPEDRKVAQRNGTHAGPDYRLYKSEPELTTVAEVDETSGEERADQATERESTNPKVSYPVGIVPPRTKSPMPESSTIASYVTLRKSKKPDARTQERPRSAVEQLCMVEGSRPRMSVEEQLQRIRKHQQGALREKKKGLNVLGVGQENSPSRSPSFSKENPFRPMQGKKRDEGFCSDLQELEASLRQQELVDNHESPAEEIARLKEAAEPEIFNIASELSKPEKVPIAPHYFEPNSEESMSPEEEADKQKKVDRIKALIAKNSMQNMMSGLTLSPEEGTEEETTAQEQEKIINISYDLAAEASKRSKLVAAQALASVKTYT